MSDEEFKLFFTLGRLSVISLKLSRSLSGDLKKRGSCTDTAME